MGQLTIRRDVMSVIYNFQPTLMFDEPQEVEITAIDDKNDFISQSRVGSVNSSRVRELADSIDSIGLKEPIHLEYHAESEEHPHCAQYVLRDGNHRYRATKELKQKSIKAYIYKQHDSEDAWQYWQFNQNKHQEKVHQKNSQDDIVFVIYNLLCNGALNKKAAEEVKAGNWKAPSVKNTIINFLKKEYNGSNANKHIKWRTAITAAVFSMGGAIYNKKVRVPSASDVKDIIDNVYNIDTTTKNGGGHLSGDEKSRIFLANSDDSTAKSFSPLYHLIKKEYEAAQLNQAAVGKNKENIMVFYSKKADPKNINSERIAFKKTIQRINDWFMKHVSGYQNKPLIDKVKYAGQILDTETPAQLYDA